MQVEGEANVQHIVEKETSGLQVCNSNCFSSNIQRLNTSISFKTTLKLGTADVRPRLWKQIALSFDFILASTTVKLISNQPLVNQYVFPQTAMMI